MFLCLWFKRVSFLLIIITATPSIEYYDCRILELWVMGLCYLLGGGQAQHQSHFSFVFEKNYSKKILWFCVFFYFFLFFCFLMMVTAITHLVIIEFFFPHQSLWQSNRSNIVEIDNSSTMKEKRYTIFFICSKDWLV